MPVIWLLSILLIASLVVFVLLLISLGRFFDRRNLPPEPADAALVFGCGLDWKAQARLATSLEVFRRGSARYLIVSGGVIVPGTEMTEAEWFQARLIEQGVPSERILLEDRATNTAENAQFALPIIERHGFRTIILVMSDFEGIRAHLTAKRAWQGRGIKIYDCHAPSCGHWSPWSWWLTREGRQLTWYTLPRLFRYRLLRYLWQAE